LSPACALIIAELPKQADVGCQYPPSNPAFDLPSLYE
jgi:hypothetical protein